MRIKKLLQKIYPFNYSIVSEDNIKTIPLYKSFLNFNVHSFRSGKILNGWKVPYNWKLEKGEISTDDKIIHKAEEPFGVPVLSPSFKGRVDRKTLLKHIFTSKKIPSATPYNWTGLYRDSKNWGFCMPKNSLKKFKDNKYHINIKTRFKKSSMKVLDFQIKGKSKNTVIINAHNCHPFQANDDMSGCAVAISIFKELKKFKNLYYTYRLLISPEITGTVFWLNKLKNESKNFKYCILLKSVGNDNFLKLQHSYQKKTTLDKIAKKLLKQKFKHYRIGGFREIYGNDETVFNSPGYDIPTISITRVPFKEYHTNFDTPKIVSEKKLQEVKSYTLGIIKNMEKDRKDNKFYRVNFNGLVSLSNKKYNLYLNAIAPGIDKKKYTQSQKQWNLMMNNLPNDINFEKLSVNEIAKKYKLPINDLQMYLNKWEKKRLISREI